VGLHAVGSAEGFIPAGAPVKVAQVGFDDAEIVFGPIPKTRVTRTAVEGLFDLAAAIDTGNDSEIVDLYGISQEIIQRGFLVVEPDPVGDGIFVFVCERPKMTSQDHGQYPFYRFFEIIVPESRGSR
jgi:hypothetical protein